MDFHEPYMPWSHLGQEVEHYQPLEPHSAFKNLAFSPVMIIALITVTVIA